MVAEQSNVWQKEDDSSEPSAQFPWPSHTLISWRQPGPLGHVICTHAHAEAGSGDTIVIAYQAVAGSLNGMVLQAVYCMLQLFVVLALSQVCARHLCQSRQQRSDLLHQLLIALVLTTLHSCEVNFIHFDSPVLLLSSHSRSTAPRSRRSHPGSPHRHCTAGRSRGTGGTQGIGSATPQAENSERKGIPNSVCRNRPLSL